MGLFWTGPLCTISPLSVILQWGLWMDVALHKLQVFENFPKSLPSSSSLFRFQKHQPFLIDFTDHQLYPRYTHCEIFTCTTIHNMVDSFQYFELSPLESSDNIETIFEYGRCLYREEHSSASQSHTSPNSIPVDSERSPGFDTHGFCIIA